MRIVQTNKAYFPKVGGIETTITNLSEGLIKRSNVSVKVLTCNDQRSTEYVKKKLNGVEITYLPTFGFVASLPISVAYMKSLSRLDGDILHVHEPFPWADLSYLFSKKIRSNFRKLVVSWHSDIVRQKWALSFYRPYIHKFLKMADKILVSNNNLIENSDYLPEYKAKCEVIPLGAKLDWVNNSSNRTDRVKKIKNEYSSPLILFVGRLVYYKGIQYLIDAINQVPNVLLVIIGSGPLKKELMNQIQNLNLEKRIHLLPEVDEESLHSFYEACDIFVLPSVEKSETYGIVQIEAMACGKPVICTELKTGTTFINQNGTTGLVVPPRDSKALAEAINRLANNGSLRDELGKNARQRALNELTAEKMVEKTFKVYNDLLKNKKNS
jgi:glycosyltransferase involved in cell wall biosynthesis